MTPTSLPGAQPRFPLDQVIAQHGALTVLLAALRALLPRRAPPVLHPQDLNDHLLRDIGIEPLPKRPHWRDLTL